MSQVKRKRKWNWEEARRLALIHEREPATIVSCWRDGRPLGQKTISTNAKTNEIDLALTIMVQTCQGPLTRTAIAEVCGCSREAIRQIEFNALKKMRERTKEIRKEIHATRL